MRNAFQQILLDGGESTDFDLDIAAGFIKPSYCRTHMPISQGSTATSRGERCLPHSVLSVCADLTMLSRRLDGP